MIALVLRLSILLMVHPPEEHPADVCRCVEARAIDGWCPKCEVGYYGGVKIKSIMLFEALDLHGHEIDPAKTRCESCKAALKSGGFCEECHMGFINGRGYFSRVCYSMAKGDQVRPPPGQSYAERWCPDCRTGHVGNREFHGQDDCAGAAHWMAVLRRAAEKADECASCATAMISDGRCFRCRVQYRDGVPVQGPASPKP